MRGMAYTGTLPVLCEANLEAYFSIRLQCILKTVRERGREGGMEGERVINTN